MLVYGDWMVLLGDFLPAGSEASVRGEKKFFEGPTTANWTLAFKDSSIGVWLVYYRSTFKYWHLFENEETAVCN